MRKLIIALAVSLSFSSVAQKSDYFDRCIVIASLGKTVMQVRQNGVLMADMITLAKESEPEWRKPLLALTKIAYQQPIYYTQRIRDRAVSDFQYLSFKHCSDHMESKQ